MSECGTYRYLLQRFWNPRLETACFLMLNPSTATADADDPTVARCVERAKRLGFGSLEVVNLFALRSTDPSALKRHPDPVGPDNDGNIIASAKVSQLVVCAWGEHGKYLDRGNKVLALLRAHGIRPHALKVSKSGQPAHPLYLPYALEPTPL